MIASICFCILAGVFNAIMDTLQFRFNTSIFKGWRDQFWNPELSWMNKWKGGDKKNGERFPLSSTVLVFTTDGWHLMKSGLIFSFAFAIVCYSPHWGFFWDFLILNLVYRSVFEFLFRHMS